MVKIHKVSRAISTFSLFMSNWVVRAALLSLGLWVFPLQPNVHLHSKPNNPINPPEKACQVT